jgi:two-component system phosphate regulon sensor histidine kinase PhoR
MFDEIIDQFVDKAAKKGVKIRYSEGTGSTYVKADSRRIRQVITNLLSNAIKYIEDKKGEIVVSFIPDGSDIRISVSDTGIGIPPDHQKRIFERFYRIDKSRSKGKGGSGLGLAIAKHIVEAHNGRILVNSKEGEGSTFIFNLKAGEAVARKEEEKALEF